jgi:3-oxoadipate enol-lactonase
MFANILGTNIYYEVASDGPPILFVHGLGGTGNVWHAQRQGLAKFFKVITIDLPGSGRSDKTERDYSMERWADQVMGLADALKLDKLTLVGHSMTTILAQKAAAKYGPRLNALVLCGPLTELPPAGKEAFVKRAESVLKEGMLAVADAVLGGALSPATREANPVLAGLYREMLLANDPAAYAAQCHALINGSARADQPNIKCPTLILLGDQDGVTPLSMARAIAGSIARCAIRIIPATAHLTMAERPEVFNATLLEFLAGL